jgi:hypothetical protein
MAEETTMRRSLALSVGLFMTVMVIGSPSGARADLIYVTGSDSALGALDPTTGVITKIGATSVLLGGIGSGANGELYGLGVDDNLYVVNAVTAALTLIGPTSVNLSHGWSMGNASDGTLFAEGNPSVGNGLLYAINPNSGASTIIGGLGFSTSAQLNGDASGNLYIVDNANLSLYRISRTTGAGTLVGPGTYGDIYGLAYTNGTMYAMEAAGPGIYSLDLTNGKSTQVSDYDPSVIGYIYAAAVLIQPTSVPEPSSLVLVGIGALGLLGLRIVRIRTNGPR